MIDRDCMIAVDLETFDGIRTIVGPIEDFDDEYRVTGDAVTITSEDGACVVVPYGCAKSHVTVRVRQASDKEVDDYVEQHDEDWDDDEPEPPEGAA